MGKINLAITGCMGRMGQQLIKSVIKDKSTKLVALTENRLISKKINGVDTSLDPLNKHFFSSDSYQDLVNLNLSDYSSSEFNYSDPADASKSSILSLKDCFIALM